MASIGIDLGTTYSVLAYVDSSGNPKIIPNQEGHTLTPSVILFQDDRPIVGNEAKEYQRSGARNVASFFKRMMGDSYYEFEYNNQLYDATILSSLVLKKLKEDAEQFLGYPIHDAVITVPAYFNNLQREATVEAGKRAGLNVLNILNEPTAAAIAYGIQEITGSRNILVYDFGGGTFDITVANVNESSINVLATDGDYNLGGKDFDDRIVLYACEQFQATHGVDPLEDESVLNELLTTAEQVKKRLTHVYKVSFTIVYQHKKETYEITQQLFEEISKDLLDRTWTIAEVALKNAGLNWKQIDEVILVGGSTRMPMVPRFIKEQLGITPRYGINADEVVAVGAAIQANLYSEKLKQTNPKYFLGAIKQVKDVMSHSLGMVAINEDYTRYINSIMIAKNTPIPTTAKKTYKLKTASQGENFLEIYVTQGENIDPFDCTIIGKYVVTDIPSINPEMNIEVTYAYDENGIVQISATEKSTKQSLPVKIERHIEDLYWLSQPPKQMEVMQEEVSVMMLIDTSYSMKGKPIKEAVKAAHQFVTELGLTQFSIGLSAFADEVFVLQSPTKNEQQLRYKINELTDYVIKGTLGFNTNAKPLSKLRKELLKLKGKIFILVLTDGLWFESQAAIDSAKQCKKDGIEIIAVGFGSANKEFLSAIATSDKNALLTNLNQLVQSFTKIAQVVSEKSLTYKRK